MLGWALVGAAAAQVAAGGPREVRDAHTVELGAGALAACKAEGAGVDPCKSVTTVRLHGDHRFARGVLLAWDGTGERRAWYEEGTSREVKASWRTALSLGVGWHTEGEWGDMRLWVGPSLERVQAEHTRGGCGRGGRPWLDPEVGCGGKAGWFDPGLVIGNDLDWPAGPVRVGLRYRFRGGFDVGDGVSGVALDIWELHALSLAAPWTGPVGAYLEVGWTNQFTLPLQTPQFRIAPWLFAGIQVRAGRTDRLR